MATKKNRFILFDLQWCEGKLKEWMTDIDKHPFDSLEDRWGLKQTQKGGVTHVIVATIEQQKESLRKTMKDIVEILPRINDLREQDAIQKEELKAKGGIDIPEIMKR